MNSPRFIRFTPAHQPGDVFVRSDAVTSVAAVDYINQMFSPPGMSGKKATVISTMGGGYSYVKESPSQVIEALRAAENTHYVTVEYVMEDGDTSSLADDCDHALALKEAQDDARIADERAEWFKKLAETRLTMYEQARADADRYYDYFNNASRSAYAAAAERNSLKSERDQLLAKLKDTTAALERANAELAAIPHDANAAHNAFINSIKSAM